MSHQENEILELSKRITNETKLCGSIAGAASKLGPRMHNAGYEHLGLNFIYMAFSVSNAKGAIEGMRALNIRGLAVSMPHKQEVMKYLDEIDPTASSIGAVNTIVNEGGRLKGYNSDWIGAVKAFEEKTSIGGKKALVIGAGGASRAICYGLKSKGANVFIYNRTIERAKTLANELGLEVGGDLEALNTMGNYDILVNATPVGSNQAIGQSIIPKRFLKSGKVVFDAVFFPLKTRLMQDAEDTGCIVIPGYRMLVHQAIFQFEVFTGQKAPFSVMERALREGLSS